LGATTQSADVIVIGAGAAGLAAADELARKGRHALVLEARERVGGRCWTRRMPGLQIPVELGAEFLHGEAKVTHALLKKAGLRAVDSVRGSVFSTAAPAASTDCGSSSAPPSWRPASARRLVRRLLHDAAAGEDQGFARMMVEGSMR
jgi:monoamine oxidase